MFVSSDAGSTNWVVSFVQPDAGGGVAIGDVAVASTGCSIDVLTRLGTSEFLRVINVDGGLTFETRVESVASSAPLVIAAQSDLVVVAGLENITMLPFLKVLNPTGTTLRVATNLGPLIPSFALLDSAGGHLHGERPGTYLATHVDLSTGLGRDGGQSSCSGLNLTSGATAVNDVQVVTGFTSSASCMINNAQVVGSGTFVAAIHPNGPNTTIVGLGGVTGQDPLVSAGGNTVFAAYRNASFLWEVVRFSLTITGSTVAFSGPNVVAGLSTELKVYDLVASPAGDVVFIVGDAASGGTINGVGVPHSGGSGADPFAVRLAPDGGVGWVRGFGGTAFEYTRGAALLDDQLILVGYCGGSGSALCQNGTGSYVISVRP